jgi:hypothetical protein
MVIVSAMLRALALAVSLRSFFKPMSSILAANIQAVSTPADLELFLDVPKQVYANDPHWVPPIRSAIASQLSPTNPFRTYGTLQAFIALVQDKPVGRIVASVNQRLIEREGEPIGLFGYFECIPDIDIAKALFAAAQEWLQAQGTSEAPSTSPPTIAASSWWRDLTAPPP